jgi:pyrroloquinoline quinone biosynthesis protein D
MTREAISADGRPKIASRARLQTDRVSGKPMLLYPEGVLVLNPTGLAIVTLCTGTATLRDIVATLAQRYQVQPSDITAEVTEYLDRLRARNLLEVLVEGEGEPRQ